MPTTSGRSPATASSSSDSTVVQERALVATVFPEPGSKLPIACRQSASSSSAGA